MDFEQKIKHIIDLLVENEIIIADLYKLFSEKFEQDRVFWVSIAVEEKIHAAHIKKLADDFDKHKLMSTEADFDENILKSHIELIESLIQKYLIDDLSTREAGNIALKIESSMVERRFFEIIDKNIADGNKISNMLKDETESHIRRIKEYIGNH